MGLDNINDRPVQPNPLIDRELAPGAEDVTETQVQVDFENARSHMEEMLQMNYGVIHELLGQIGAINPFRPDSAQGKQPDVAAVDASDSVQSAPVAPVGKASASAYIAGLQHINDALANHDMEIQQVFDQLALSRSGRKPDLINQGIEYEQLLSIVRQTEYRLSELKAELPETLPNNSSYSLQELLPEFSENLKHYHASFNQLQAMVQELIRQAKATL